MLDAKHEEYLGTTKILSKSLKLQLADTYECTKQKENIVYSRWFFCVEYPRLSMSEIRLILQLSLNE